MRDAEQLDQEIELRAQANPFGGGVDWLEVRVPQNARFRPRVQEIFGGLRRREECGGVKKSEHYAAVVDLRHYDVADAMLHVGKKRGDTHDHKIQLIGTGQFSFREQVMQLEAIVDADPMKLQPMRTDLTVDVPDVPVSWAVRHVRAAGKRFHAKIGKVEPWMEVGTREVQTYYEGKQPNCFRIYDKKAERLAAYQKFIRGWHPAEPSFEKWMKQATTKTGLAFEQFQALCYRRGLDPSIELQKAREDVLSLRPFFDLLHDAWEKKVAEIGPRPSFQEFCGMREDQVLTRFERQIGAQQIGKLYLVGDSYKRPIFSSLAEVERNAPDFNPFASLDISKPGRAEPALPDGSNYSLIEYMAGMYFRQRVLTEGRGAAEKWATKYARGNMASIARRLAPFMPAESEESSAITSAELFERYRSAIQKQLAA